MTLDEAVKLIIVYKIWGFLLYSDPLTRTSSFQNLFDYGGKGASSMLPFHTTPQLLHQEDLTGGILRPISGPSFPGLFPS